MRYAFIAMAMLIGAPLAAASDVSFSIGINVPMYPQFVRVPEYPVYYAPQAGINLFFYDGMYWAYQNDNWYASSWYNGPWQMVGPQYVPVYILRVPVRYYQAPPRYFYGWATNQPPRWDQYWGASWARERQGWQTWNRNSAPPPAPLPVYQRDYSGNRYPPPAQQYVIRSQYYHYQPSDPVARQQYEQHGPPAAQGKNGMPPGQAKKQGNGGGNGEHDSGKGDR